jgi:hypothetical protein
MRNFDRLFNEGLGLTSEQTVNNERLQELLDGGIIEE